MIEAIGKKGDEVFYKEILKWVLDNRYKDKLEDYESFRVENGNYLPESRDSVYELLNKFKLYHELTGNWKYLEIPHQEYVSDKWIVRWSWRLFFFSKRFGERMDGVERRPSYQEEYDFLKGNYKPNQKISDEYKLKRPWLIKKEPRRLMSGAKINDGFFATILNDLFSSKN